MMKMQIIKVKQKIKMKKKYVLKMCTSTLNKSNKKKKINYIKKKI